MYDHPRFGLDLFKLFSSLSSKFITYLLPLGFLGGVPLLILRDSGGKKTRKYYTELSISGRLC